jgi:serine/threonine-protein kinase
LPDEAERIAAQARVGTVLRGKYTVDSVLGVGGMAVVYAVTHRNRKRFALKMLRQEVSQQPSVRERFLREGYVANTVDHPGAVAVLDDDIDEDGTAYLVMELLDGRSVDALADQAGGRLPVAPVVSIALQLLDVLVAAHARGVVHRDIKPANLFLTVDGQVKVLDFGIARIREVAGVAQTTHTGGLFGTPAFMSPEQAAGRMREIDEQTDVWAVGATMFTLLTGRLVHHADNTHALLLAAATTDPPALRSMAPHVPADVCAVVDRALARSKVARWPSAGAMRAALAATQRAASAGRMKRASVAPPDPFDLSLMQTVAALPPSMDTVARAEAETGGGDALPVLGKLSTEMSASLPAGASPRAPPAPRIARSAFSRRAGLATFPLLGVVLAVGAYGLLRARRPTASADPSVSSVSSVASVPNVEPDPSTNVAQAPPTSSEFAAPVASGVAPPTAPSSFPAPTARAVATSNGVASRAPVAASAPPRATPTAASAPARPPVARPAPSSGCFYFDPALSRIVAKAGCR